MFARVVNFTGVTDIDGGIQFSHDVVAPLLHQQNGFAGMTASADRAGRVLGVLSLWRSAEDRAVSESAMAKARDEGLGVVGGEMSVEYFEQVVWDVAAPPTVGSALLLRRVTMDVAKIDENIEYFKTEVVPEIKAGRGFLAVRHMVNRETGSGMVGTVWTDAAAMEAAAEEAASRIQQRTPRVTFGEQSRREVVFIDMP